MKNYGYFKGHIKFRGDESFCFNLKVVCTETGYNGAHKLPVRETRTSAAEPATESNSNESCSIFSIILR